MANLVPATLHPGEQFPLVFLIGDHTDTATYFVRAVIRRSSNRETLSTVDLTDRGSRLFDGTWQVADDTSGRGMWINITYTIYENSAYTIRSARYHEDQYDYLVIDRLSSGGVGGGFDFNYKQLRKIVAEEVRKIKTADLADALVLLRKIGSDVSRIPTENVDLQPVISRVGDAIKAVDAIEPPDFAPVLNAIKGIDPERLHGAVTRTLAVLESVDTTLEEIKTRAQEANQTFLPDTAERMERIAKNLEAVKTEFKDFLGAISVKNFRDSLFNDAVLRGKGETENEKADVLSRRAAALL